jgi:hypothetical protein
MTETSALTPQPGSMHAITYSYGESSLGSFLAAIDEEEACAPFYLAMIATDCGATCRRNLWTGSWN